MLYMDDQESRQASYFLPLYYDFLEEGSIVIVEYANRRISYSIGYEMLSNDFAELLQNTVNKGLRDIECELMILN